MIKVVIFDAVGLLTKQEPLSRALASGHGIPLEKTLPFFTGALQDCVAGQADLKEVLPPYLNEWGWDKGVDALLELWFERDHKLDTELISYIHELRKNGTLCVLGTNNEKYRYEYMLDKMGFADIFDKTYSSAYIGHKKPSPHFFMKIVGDLKDIDKEDILFWDDKLENVQSAKDFGIRAEHFISTEDFKEKMKNYTN